MDFNLKLITAPITEPVTTAEVKMHAHIDHAIEDTIISLWIKTGRELAEAYQRRAYHSQVWEVSFDDFPLMPISIPRPPLISVESIKYYNYLNNESTYNLANLIIDNASEPGRIDHVYNQFWPVVTLRKIDALKIKYTAGYSGAIPSAVKEAIILYCAYRNENRAAETESLPPQFYSLLNHDRIYL